MSVQVSSLALRYIFLWWWGCNLYGRLVIRCVSFGTLLSLACLCLTFSCKQNDSSEVLSSSKWSYEALLCTCVPPACNWCALGFLCLKGACFFWKHILVKCPNLWQALHWYFFAGHWNPSICTESLHLEHLVLSLCTPLMSNFFLGCACKCYPSWPWFLLFDCLGFILDLFVLYFPAGSSVLWCLRRLIWAACGSPATCLIWHAVAFELSIFWQAASLCLWGTSPNLHCHHWWSWRQTLHHARKTRICPSARS